MRKPLVFRPCGVSQETHIKYILRTGSLAITIFAREKIMTTSQNYQLPPKEGFVLTHFLTVADVQRSAEFYLRILGGTLVRSGEPTILRIANSWLIWNVGGGPTGAKPTVTLHVPESR